MKKAFKNWRAGAIAINFPNGNHLSTTFASGSYSDNYLADTNLWDVSFSKGEFVESDTCEVLFTCGEKLSKKINKKFNQETDNTILGHLSFEEWLWVVNQLNNEKK